MAQKSLELAGHPHIEGDSKYGFRKVTFIPSDTRQANAVNGTMEYDESDDAPVFYNGTSWVTLGVASTAGTGLDGAYDLNKTITVDSTTLTLAGSSADVLTVTQSANDDNIIITKTGTGAGNLIKFTNAGTGDDIQGTSDTWAVTAAGVATFTTVTGTDLTMVGTQTITTDDTSSSAINIEADSLTTGTAIKVDSNTGAAVTLLDLQNAGTSVFKVGGTGIVTLAGVAKDADAIVITDGDITLTDGDLDLTSGQFTMITDGAGDGMTLTDKTGAVNYDLLYLNGSTNAGNSHILSIAQGAGLRTGHAIDIAMGTTAVAMSAIDIDCSGGTRTAPVIAVNSDGTASDLISLINGVVFTGNYINMQQDAGAATGNFIFINNDTGTSMEAINIDDEANVEDVILVNAKGNTGAGNALVNLVSTGTPNATANAILVNWAGITATSNPYAVKIDTNGKDASALNIDADSATNSAVLINGGGAIATTKAVLEITADGAPAAATSNVLRVDGSGMTATAKPILVEVVGGGKTVRGLYVDADIVDNHVVQFNSGGALTDGKAVLALTNDSNLAAGGNLLNVTMGGTPVNATACAVEILAAKDCLALDIASSAAATHCAQITGSGATANDKAVLNLAWGAIVPANAGSNILRVDGSAATTTTNKPVLAEIYDDSVATGLVVNTACTANDVVDIIVAGALADNMAGLNITSSGNLATGGNLLRLITGGTPHANSMALEISSGVGQAVSVTSAAVGNIATLTGTGVTAAGNAVLAVTSSGAIADGSYYVDITSGAAGVSSSTSYLLHVDATHANIEGLHVDSGNVLFDENFEVTGTTTCTGQITAPAGVQGILGTAANLTDVTPTSAEFDTAFGSGNKTKGGFTGVVEDSDSNVAYLVVSDGTTWHFALLTAAAA